MTKPDEVSGFGMESLEIPEHLVEEVQRLEAELDRSLAYWDPRYHGIATELRSWAELASSDAAGGFFIDEYIHQLGSRDTLHEALLVSEEPLRHWLLRTVDRIDDAYVHVTDLDTDDLMWGGNVDKPCHWWHRRLPRDDRLRTAIAELAPKMRKFRENRHRSV